MAKLKGTVWLVGVAIYFGRVGMAKADEDVDVRLVAETFFERCSRPSPLQSAASWSRCGKPTRFRSRSRASILA